MNVNRRNTIAVARSFAVYAALIAGCSDSSPATRPTSADRALSDPWNYGPKPGVPDKDLKKDDSSFDSEGLKKDLNNVFNP